MTAEPAPHRICLSPRTVLEFDLGDGRTYRIPEPNRGQITRCRRLELEVSAGAPEIPASGFATPESRETTCDRNATAFRRFAMASSEAPKGGNAPEHQETLRATQLAILTEAAEPALEVESLSAAEGVQILWALIAAWDQFDPRLAAQVCGLHILGNNEEAAV